jgi:hypothetical protein
MLFNPAWTKRADSFALDTLIAWLETQHPHRVYNYKSSCDCLLAQYFAAQGFDNAMVSRSLVTSQLKLPHGMFMSHALMPEHFDAIARAEPHTFGAALERAWRLRDGE